MVEGPKCFYKFFFSFLKIFFRRLKKDHDLSLLQAIPLSKDVTDSDNNYLTREVLEEELRQVNQISPLNAPGPDGMHGVDIKINNPVCGGLGMGE